MRAFHVKKGTKVRGRSADRNFGRGWNGWCEFETTRDCTLFLEDLTRDPLKGSSTYGFSRTTQCGLEWEMLVDPEDVEVL